LTTMTLPPRRQVDVDGSIWALLQIRYSGWNFKMCRMNKGTLTGGGGRLSAVDLLIKVARFVKKINNFCNIKSNWSKLVSRRRLTERSLPLPQGFPELWVCLAKKQLKEIPRTH
jgi:hypothetical protein